MLSSWAFKTARERSPRDATLRSSLAYNIFDFDERESIFSEGSDERESILTNAAETLKRSLLVSREFPQGKFRTTRAHQQRNRRDLKTLEPARPESQLAVVNRLITADDGAPREVFSAVSNQRPRTMT